MPILTLQRQFRELGRVRMGQQVLGTNGKKRPDKLSTWRLTSPDHALLEVAAQQYGGEVVDWPEAPDGDAFQLVTKADELEILVPPGAPLTQWNELWSGAGCQRRCDGQREWLTNVPCICPADPGERNELAAKGQACKPTTRLQVILPKLPDLGTWMYVSHGFYAAVELAGTADLLAAASAGGRMVNAVLAIEQRQVKRPGQPTKKFPVPAIRIRETMTGLLAGGGSGPALLSGGAAERIPAQLTTSAPLPTETSFSTRPPDAPPCRHDPSGFESRAEGVVCTGCGLLMARRDHPAAEAGVVAVRTASGGADGSSGLPAPTDASTLASSPPGGGSPASDEVDGHAGEAGYPQPATSQSKDSTRPSPATSSATTMADAQTRVGNLAVQHRLVAQIVSDEDWSRFDDVMRMHGVEPLPLEATPEAIEEWNALGDRIARGEFDPADDPAGRCQAHGEPWKWVPPGTKRDGSGKKYNGFFCCPTRDCSARPTDAWRRANRPADWKAE